MFRVHLGQHFLKDGVIADRIVAAAYLKPGDEVIEIGPGRGVLTRRLLESGARVTAVELDARLHETLGREFEGSIGAGTLTLIHADFLKISSENLPSPCAFVANLPYSVASPILQKILIWPVWTHAVLMFQREVAERILAQSGQSKYGVLSISVALRAQTQRICDAPREAFSPAPRIQSTVVRLKPLGQLRLPADVSEEKFMTVVHAAFQHRRKKAANSISHALECSREVVENALQQTGVSTQARAQDIPFDSFIQIARLLSK